MRTILFLVALLASAASIADGVHKIVFQINDNDPKRMNLVLNNVANVNKYYQDQGEEVQIEVVAFGPGLVMLNAANTMAKMKKKSGKDVPLVPQAKVVQAGVVHIVQRQEQGWSYIRP